MTLSSKEICALTLSFIALTDIFIVLDVPILRQVFGFALLTFLPGFLIIQLIRFAKTSLVKTLFLIGLSISFLLFVPLIMNFAYPLVSIPQPISLSPLVATFSVILAGLSLAAYKKGVLDLQINTGGFKKLVGTTMAPPVLGAALIVVIGILGGLCVRFYLDSIFSLLLALIIVLIVVLITISNKVSQRYYPLYILAIAIALQYSRTLASPNLFGSDGMYELYFANLVKASGFWDPSFAIKSIIISDYYAMLSVALLPNVYSIVLNLDTVWVFKLIFPFIFAFVPVGLYEILRTQVKFSSKSAFLAVFLFVSFFAFVQFMPSFTRQEIGELFFVLVLLLIMNKSAQESKRNALLVLFISSMVVSHYATSYIFLFYLGIVYVGSALVFSRNRQKGARVAVPAKIVVLAVVIVFGWYIFAGAGTPFQALLRSSSNIVGDISQQSAIPSNSSKNVAVSSNSPNNVAVSSNSPNNVADRTDRYVAAGLGGGLAGLPLIHALGRYWQIATEILIMIGLVSVIWRRKTPRMSPQFLLFSLASLFIVLVVVALPSVSVQLNSWRVYSFALFFFAPCCIFGVYAIVETISRRFVANRGLVLKLTSAALIAVIVPYFLLSYGFVYEIAEHPSNYAFLPTQNLNGRGINYFSDATWSYMVSGPVPTESVYASSWLSGSMKHSPVYADTITVPELAAYGHISPDSTVVLKGWSLNNPLGNAYIYLGAANVQQQSIVTKDYSRVEERSISSIPGVIEANRVYSNGLVEVYYSE